MKQPKSMAHHWYDALLVCRLLHNFRLITKSQNYDLNNVPAQFGRVTININHFNFSFHDISTMGMPFQSWLLQNDRVACFGNRTVMNCSLFDQDLANTCLPQSLVITNFSRMNASENQRCIALPFGISLLSLSHGCVFCNVFTPFPLMPPSSPNTKPSPLDLRSCCTPNAAPSGLSSVEGPGPRPGRRHMTWETRMKHTARIRYRKHAKISP